MPADLQDAPHALGPSPHLPVRRSMRKSQRAIRRRRAVRSRTHICSGSERRSRGQSDSPIPLQLALGDLDLGADVEVGAIALLVGPFIGDDGVGLSVADVNLVSEIGIGFAAT